MLWAHRRNVPAVDAAAACLTRTIPAQPLLSSPCVPAAAQQMAGPLVAAARDRGIIVITAGKGDIVRLVPPLIVRCARWLPFCGCLFAGKGDTSGWCPC